MECSCAISGCGDEGYDEEYEQKDVVFDSELIILKCGECGRKIEKGEKYEWYRGQYDGRHYTHNTCLDCVSLRDNFFSEWTFERLWDDFYYHMEDCDWQVPEKCLASCTPNTRERICANIEEFWKED